MKTRAKVRMRMRMKKKNCEQNVHNSWQITYYNYDLAVLIVKFSNHTYFIDITQIAFARTAAFGDWPDTSSNSLQPQKAIKEKPK